MKGGFLNLNIPDTLPPPLKVKRIYLFGCRDIIVSKKSPAVRGGGDFHLNFNNVFAS